LANQLFTKASDTKRTGVATSQCLINERPLILTAALVSNQKLVIQEAIEILSSKLCMLEALYALKYKPKKLLRTSYIFAKLDKRRSKTSSNLPKKLLRISSLEQRHTPIRSIHFL